MNTITMPQRMTIEEFLALPNDGVERDLIDGLLKERPMTRRGRRHCRTTAAISEWLRRWLRGQPEPRGEILAGDAGFLMSTDPDTSVGIDIAYISAETAALMPDDVFLIDRPPILAVEILSPSDKQEDVLLKIEHFLRFGVALVWIVEPVFRTVTVYRPGQEPELYNSTQEIAGDPHLPGFRAPVAEFFE